MRVIDSFPLLYHELGHLWHFQRRTAPAWAEDPAARALWQLYTEGMATYVQQRLFGGRSFYSQDRDGWLAWCGAWTAAKACRISSGTGARLRAVRTSATTSARSLSTRWRKTARRSSLPT